MEANNNLEARKQGGISNAVLVQSHEDGLNLRNSYKSKVLFMKQFD